MAIGPVSYIIVGFPGNEFNGNIASELEKLVGSGRGPDPRPDLRHQGRSSATSRRSNSTSWTSSAPFGEIDAEVGGLANPEDIEYRGFAARARYVGGPPHLGGHLGGSFRRSCPRSSGGVLLESARIPHEIIEAAMAELTAAL